LLSYIDRGKIYPGIYKLFTKIFTYPVVHNLTNTDIYAKMKAEKLLSFGSERRMHRDLTYLRQKFSTNSDFKTQMSQTARTVLTLPFGYSARSKPKI